jgi:hypothetical protein
MSLGSERYELYRAYEIDENSAKLRIAKDVQNLVVIKE